VIFPPDYRITKQAVGKAFRHEIRGRVELQARELRELAAGIITKVSIRIALSVAQIKLAHFAGI
jgi:hypothetical protein